MRVHRSAGASAHRIMPPTYRPIRCAVTRVAVRASACDGRPRSHYHPARSTRRRCHERWPPAVVRYRVSHAQMHQHALKCSCDRSSGVKRVRVLSFNRTANLFGHFFENFVTDTVTDILASHQGRICIEYDAPDVHHRSSHTYPRPAHARVSILAQF